MKNPGTMTCLVLMLSAAIVSPAQTFTTLVNFNGTNGDNPSYMSLVQGTDGNLYGTTFSGGKYGEGSIFRITPAGVPKTLYSFCFQSPCYDGRAPSATLVQGTNGDFYGTTEGGGVYNEGTVFKVTSGGKLTTLYSFCTLADCADGSDPVGGLVDATNGDFYGTTYGGGLHAGGTVFKITSSGKLSTLYSFCALASCADGEYPFAALIQGTNGKFYGTTMQGGTGNEPGGTVFDITSGGKLTTIYSFCSKADCADGSNPGSALIQATYGEFYGTTRNGGAHAGGTIFTIHSSGTLVTLYSFCSQVNCDDGQTPESGLTHSTYAYDENFYGTTYYGGGGTADCNGYSGCGTVFEFSLNGSHGNQQGGTETVLHSFDGTDGWGINGGLVLATNGTLYGTSSTGGSGYGTVFSLPGLVGPFVEMQPTSGKVGAKVTILGTNLAGTTSVSFPSVITNGVDATFTVVSNSEITAIVPNSATTGDGTVLEASVNVTTPSGILSSNQPFRVTPQITSFTPPSGPVGTALTITGVSLTDTRTLSVGGVKAGTFGADGDSQVNAIVPTGAKTGKIVLTTLGGTAASATVFTVTP